MAHEHNLKKLRSEIDEIDDTIHRHLVRRADVVQILGREKTKQPGISGMRPLREAAVVKRLLRQHTGSLPHGVIFRIWREIIAASLRLQAPTTVAIYAPNQAVAYWDLARNHFGSITPMTLHRSCRMVLRLIATREYGFGILPIPKEDDDPPWWPLLANMPEPRRRIIMRLPYLNDESITCGQPSALVVGPTIFEQSDHDISLLAARATTNLDKSRLTDALRSVGIVGHCIANIQQPGNPTNYLYLLEANGYLVQGDERLSVLRNSVEYGLKDFTPLGGYSTPIERPKMSDVR